MKLEPSEKNMSLIIEIPDELEGELREHARRRGLTPEQYLTEVALELIRQDKEQQLRSESQERTRISEELGLHEESDFSPAQEAELA